MRGLKSKGGRDLKMAKSSSKATIKKMRKALERFVNDLVDEIKREQKKALKCKFSELEKRLRVESSRR